MIHSQCGGLKDNGPHRPIGKGTIRRCGLAEVGVSDLVGGSVSQGTGVEVSDAQVRLKCGSLSAVCQFRYRTLSSFSSTICLHAAMLPTIIIMD